jgi:hypothetical protein
MVRKHKDYLESKANTQSLLPQTVTSQTVTEVYGTFPNHTTQAPGGQGQGMVRAYPHQAVQQPPPMYPSLQPVQQQVQQAGTPTVNPQQQQQMIQQQQQPQIVQVQQPPMVRAPMPQQVQVQLPAAPQHIQPQVQQQLVDPSPISTVGPVVSQAIPAHTAPVTGKMVMAPVPNNDYVTNPTATPTPVPAAVAPHNTQQVAEEVVEGQIVEEDDHAAQIHRQMTAQAFAQHRQN